MQIAVWTSSKQQEQAQLMLNRLIADSVAVGFAAHHYVSTGASPEAILYQNEAQAVLVPLHELSTLLPNHCVLTALLVRDAPHVCMLVRERALDRGQDFFMQEGARVLVMEPVFGAQIKQYRPDIEVHWAGNVLDMPQHDGYDAVIGHDLTLDKGFVGHTLQDIRFEFQPSEMTPLAGMGAFALMTLKEDFVTRRLLKQLHSTTTSQCTNVERKFERVFAEGDINGNTTNRRKNVCAHVAQDSLGQYHGHFVVMDHSGVAHRYAISQSTYLGMAESAISWGKQIDHLND
jgi:Porphobilinogen deaminase, dipyromethane cofactor binding domain